jgi:hypothetical protein
MHRKPGTDTKFPAQFAGNWLSVPGFARAELTLSKMPVGVRAAKRGLPPIPAFGIGWLYPVCPRVCPRDMLPVRCAPKTVKHP